MEEIIDQDMEEIIDQDMEEIIDQDMEEIDVIVKIIDIKEKE